MNHRAAFALLTCALAIHACVPGSAAEIVVRIGSDIPTDELIGLDLSVHPPGEPTRVRFHASYEIANHMRVLPGDVGVVAGDPYDSSRVQIDLAVRLRSGDPFTRSAIVSFQPHRILVLDMFIAARCRSTLERTRCTAMETCGRDGCETLFPTLPDFNPDAGVDVRERLDASDARDVTVCRPGAACTATDRCHAAAIECSTGAPRCRDTTLLPAGTACGAASVCSAVGTCGPCTTGSDCVNTVACHRGMLQCAAGTPTCVDAGLLPPGTPCAGGVCSLAGDCTPCPSSSPCNSATPCHTAAIVCTSGAPVCTDTGNRPAGANCGMDHVCNPVGDCVACTAGMRCPAPNACVTWSIACGTGVPACVPVGNTSAGVACSGGVCSGTGTCNPCVAGRACPTGNACTLGAIDCGSGMPVCAATGNVAAGTGCPGGACNGTGICVASVCANGLLEMGEQCDDANSVGGDGCDAACMLETAATDTCPGALLVPSVGQRALYRGTTIGTSDDVSSTCSASTPDTLYRIRAAIDGEIMVAIDWTGSLQPVLEFRGYPGTCPGTDGGCSAATASLPSATLSITGVLAGRTYTFAVDGVAGTTGPYVLSVLSQ